MGFCKKPLDKPRKVFYNQDTKRRPADVCARAEIPLYRTLGILSRGNYAQKSEVKSPVICATLPLDFCV